MNGWIKNDITYADKSSLSTVLSEKNVSYKKLVNMVLGF